MARGSPNHDPELRHWKASDGRARREAATRAAPDAGWRPGDPLVFHEEYGLRGRDVTGVQTFPLPIYGRDPQRRPRWGAVGLLRDYAQEPDEWRHRGGRDQHHPDLFRRPARHDWRRRRDSRRNPRRSEAVPPLVRSEERRVGKACEPRLAPVGYYKYYTLC